MEENIQKFPSKADQYKSYIDFYKHYSTLMFRARISIFTLIFVSIGFIVKIIPILEEEGVNLDVLQFQVSQSSIVAYFTAVLIGILFLLETAYYRRFLGIITCLNQIEKQAQLCLGKNDKSSFFRRYNRKHHEYSIFYIVACFFLIAFFIIENRDNLLLSIIVGAIPPSFLIFVYFWILLKDFNDFKADIDSV